MHFDNFDCIATHEVAYMVDGTCVAIQDMRDGFQVGLLICSTAA